MLQLVVTRTVEGPVVTHTYAEVHERARLCALALRRLGVSEGDRIATMAWNTCRHLESWSVKAVLLCSSMALLVMSAKSDLYYDNRYMALPL